MSIFMQTPKKGLFQTPLTRRSLDLDSTAEKASASSASAEGGATTTESTPTRESTSSSTTTTAESDKSVQFDSRDEWRRVMSTLFTMKNQNEHGSTILKFIKDTLLRDETEKSAFSLTEQKVYSSLKTYLEFRQPPASNFRTKQTGVKTMDTSVSCGQKECAGRKKQHSAEQCWILYPDLKPQYCDQEACNRKRARHTAERCWILYPNLNPHKKNKSSVSSSSEEEDDDEDYEEDEEYENNEEEEEET